MAMKNRKVNKMPDTCSFISHILFEKLERAFWTLNK